MDDVLTRGTRGLSPAFVERQVEFVATCQQPDGGFMGRQGSSDPYYTDFALRVLALLAPAHPALAPAGRYLSGLAGPPGSVVECFNRLNAARLLRGVADAVSLPDGSREVALGALECRPLVTYDGFLAALCLEMLGQGSARGAAWRGLARAVLPAAWLGAEGAAVARAARCVAGRQGPGGGFGTLPGDAVEQANATAASVALLQMGGCLRRGTARQAVRYLAGMHAPGGGLRAHPAAPGGDLLSTFTGLLTLFGLGRPDAVDPAGVARFVRSAACDAGGFTAGPEDAEPDVEYTYYGLGTMALLRVLAERKRPTTGR